MWQNLNVASPVDCYSSIGNALTDLIDKPEVLDASGTAVLEHVSSKWQTLIYYAQCKISEAKAPLSGDVHLVAEVIQRKNDFEKLQRTMLANLGSAKMMIGAQIDSEAMQGLRSYEAIIAGWAAQLEKIASSLQGLLAIEESLKATRQAVRTQNLTVLAFIFIPISTVSSIYGMNTVEIAQRNPPTWQFGMTAAIVIAFAIGAALIYQSYETILRIPVARILIRSKSNALSQTHPSQKPTDHTVSETAYPPSNPNRPFQQNLLSRPLAPPRPNISPQTGTGLPRPNTMITPLFNPTNAYEAHDPESPPTDLPDWHDSQGSETKRAKIAQALVSSSGAASTSCHIM